MLLSIKNEVDRCPSKLEVGQFQVGPENNVVKVKPKSQVMWPVGRGQKEVDLCTLRREMGFNFNKLNGLEGKIIGGKGDFNVGLPNNIISVESPSL